MHKKTERLALKAQGHVISVLAFLGSTSVADVIVCLPVCNLGASILTAGLAIWVLVVVLSTVLISGLPLSLIVFLLKLTQCVVVVVELEDTGLLMRPVSFTGDSSVPFLQNTPDQTCISREDNSIWHENEIIQEVYKLRQYQATPQQWVRLVYKHTFMFSFSDRKKADCPISLLCGKIVYKCS